MSDNEASARARVVAELGARQTQLEREEIAERAAEILAVWRRGQAADVRLADAHALLPVEAVAEVIFREMLRISQSWQLRFPPRFASGALAAPAWCDAELISSARAAVVSLLRSGTLAARGQDARNPGKVVAIAPEAWNVLTADFENSSARTEAAVYQAVHVFAPASGIAGNAAPVAVAALRRWLSDYVDRYVTVGKQPPGGFEAALQAAAEHFGSKVTRAELQKHWNELVPLHLRKRGRPSTARASKAGPGKAQREKYIPRKK